MRLGERAGDLGVNGLTRGVFDYWNREPCGSGTAITGNLEPMSDEWFRKIEDHRYDIEPFIHGIAQFTRHAGKRMLEVGVGAGTDHLQWARAGAACHGVDLTPAAVETTRKHLGIYGLHSRLAVTNAEALPFGEGSFDIVYSWGVLHHAEHPEKAIGEVWRVIKPGGTFVGMLYGRYSLVAFKLWIRHALMIGKPWRSLNDVIWHHMESVGTKAYTRKELARMFSLFRKISLVPILTVYDRERIPSWMSCLIPSRLGWFVAVKAVK